MIKKLDFYFVNNEYIKYLQTEEIKLYGTAKTPIMEYPPKCHPKFLCGPLFVGLSGFEYYTPVSSYHVQKNGNILITNPKDKEPAKGSLRVNYMIPIPKELLTRYSIYKVDSFEYRCFLTKEYLFVQDFAKNIRNFATTLYGDIYNYKCSKKLLMNSSRLKFLEDRCCNYCQSAGYGIPDKHIPKYIPEQDLVLEIITKGEEKFYQDDI